MKNKQLTVTWALKLILISIFILSLIASARHLWTGHVKKNDKPIEINPKDIPGWENFTPMQAIIIQKEHLDKGHQSWRADPVQYSDLFMWAQYLKPNLKYSYYGLESKHSNAIVKIIYNDKQHVIYLHKVFPSNPKSMWIIDKVTISPGEIYKNINLERLKQVNKLLQNNKLTNIEKAGLLYEKAVLIFETSAGASLQIPTECLLGAVKLEPNNKQYRDYLRIIYKQFLKDKNLSRDDKISVDLKKLRDKAGKIVDKK